MTECDYGVEMYQNSLIVTLIILVYDMINSTFESLLTNSLQCNCIKISFLLPCVTNHQHNYNQNIQAQ